MGYGMGQEDQRAKRKARLAARYGTTEGFGALGAVLEAAANLTESPPVGLPVGTAQAPYIDQPATTLEEACRDQAIADGHLISEEVAEAPKKKGGRPKGSKNKAAP